MKKQIKVRDLLFCLSIVALLLILNSFSIASAQPASSKKVEAFLGHWIGKDAINGLSYSLEVKEIEFSLVKEVKEEVGKYDPENKREPDIKNFLIYPCTVVLTWEKCYHCRYFAPESSTFGIPARIILDLVTDKATLEINLRKSEFYFQLRDDLATLDGVISVTHSLTQRNVIKMHKVAPHAGAWIETR